VPSRLATALRERGWVCRGASLPHDSPLDLISDKPNRWNVEGEPTIYVSGDPGLALIESGRHPSDLEDGLRLFDMDLRIPNALDLRDERVRTALSLPDDPCWILDRERTNALGRSLRREGGVDALVVPSAGALDAPERYNVVVFADDRARIPELVADLRSAGGLVLSVVGA
jgi:RES domain-containing protein